MRPDSVSNSGFHFLIGHVICVRDTEEFAETPHLQCLYPAFSVCCHGPRFTCINRLVGVVVKVSPSRAEDPGFKSSLRQDFAGSSHTSDFKIGTPVDTLPGAWRSRVSAGTGRSGVSIL